MTLKEIRKKYGLSQTELAKITKTSQKTISNYENGNTEPDITTITYLADHFQTTIDSLVGHEVPYLLDKSTLTQEQRDIIDVVIQMNYEECRIMLAYIEGVKKGIEERNAIFNKKGEF